MVLKDHGFRESDFRLVQRRPVVIASPTTGTETTDALTVFNLTQKSQKPQIFLFEATIFREFREFCVTFLLSHTHLSSLTTNLILTNPFILVPTPHPFAFERFVVFHRRNSWLLSRPNLFVSIREIRGFSYIGSQQTEC